MRKKKDTEMIEVEDMEMREAVATGTIGVPDTVTTEILKKVVFKINMKKNLVNRKTKQKIDINMMKDTTMATKT